MAPRDDQIGGEITFRYLLCSAADNIRRKSQYVFTSAGGKQKKMSSHAMREKRNERSAEREGDK